jgi:AcrR family transcriptional regulator
VNPTERRAARHRPPNPDDAPKPRRRSVLITPEQVVDVALAVVAAEGYEALTMRKVAAALDTGPASLYAHVVNKADLGELLIGRLCAEISLPAPDPAHWTDQVLDVCAQLRDQYLRYPGIAQAASAVVPTDAQVLRLSEGMLSILLSGGIEPRPAAWAADALLLYVAAYCTELSTRQGAEGEPWLRDRDELRRRFAELPATAFPNVTRHAAEIISGEGHERFEFAVGLLLDGLVHRR